MKKALILTFLFTSLLTASQDIPSQSWLDMGEAKLTIQKWNSKESPVTYNFTSEQGCVFGLSNNNGEYADFSFNGDFEKGNSSTFVQVICRITPAAEGTFLLTNYDGNDPKNPGSISVNINNNLILIDGKKGTSGKITVSKYPGAGGFMSGTYEAVLSDSPDPGAIKNLYKISGNFKIKRLE
ncbi:MAG: hypothetical protein ACTHK8_15560 [Ginsengibacter sp.]|jgi:hypothetical protein